MRYTPQWLQAGSYAASVDRRLLGALWPAPASSGCAVTASAGMTVNVGAGQVAVPTQNNTGTTLCSSDATEQVTISAAPGSGLNRIDLIICRPRGNDLDGGSNTDFIFDYVTGAAAASPTVPATPAGTVALAQIYVGGGVASIVAANITDVRPGGLAVPPPAGTGSPPRGYIAGATGPASTLQLGTAVTTALTLTATLLAGRRYRLNAISSGSQQTAAGNAQMYVSDSLGLGPAWRIFSQFGVPVNQWAGGGGSWEYIPGATQALTFTLQGNTTAGTFQLLANQTQLVLEDIGSQ